MRPGMRPGASAVTAGAPRGPRPPRGFPQSTPTRAGGEPMGRPRRTLPRPSLRPPRPPPAPPPRRVLGERVHAVVVAGLALEVAALKHHCAGLLADYKVPDAITLRDTPLPRNANGKVLKRDLRQDIVKVAV